MFTVSQRPTNTISFEPNKRAVLRKKETIDFLSCSRTGTLCRRRHPSTVADQGQPGFEGLGKYWDLVRKTKNRKDHKRKENNFIIGPSGKLAKDEMSLAMFSKINMTWRSGFLICTGLSIVVAAVRAAI